MIGLATGLVWIAALQNTAPDLAPLFRPPASFNGAVGERMRIGAYGASGAEPSRLHDLGVSILFERADELGPPDLGIGSRSLKSIAAKQSLAAEAQLGFGVTAYTTFPPLDQQSLVGDGVLNLLDGSWAPAWSPWDQKRIAWSAEKYGFVNRALPSLTVLTLGIFGEYGDASFFTGLAKRDPQSQKVWEDRLRAAPPAAGFWSGDTLAKLSWQTALESKHGSYSNAYAAWGMDPIPNIQLPLPTTPSYSYAARAEYMDWYRDAMPSLVRRLVAVANEVLPNAALLVPLGAPNDQPFLGIDAFKIASAAKEADAIKVTNVGYFDFASDWAMSLARIRGAARAADVAVWTSAPTIGDAAKFEQRIFEAISLGARGHIEFAPALAERADELLRLLPDLEVGSVRCDVAVIYPSTAHGLRPNQAVPPLLYRSLLELRDYLDFDVLDESAVAAGALAKYRVAVLLEGSVWSEAALSAMKTWVESGGSLCAYDFGRVADVNGGTAIHQDLFGFAAQLPRAAVRTRWVGDVPSAYALSLGGARDEEFLLGRWGPSSGGARPAFDGAQLRLPVVPEGDMSITLLFDPTTASDTKLTLSVDGRQAASVAFEGGLSRFQFVVDRSRISGETMRVGVGGLGADKSVRVLGAIVTDSKSTSPTAELAGFFEASVELDLVRGWLNRFGDGNVVYFPGQRDLWKQYIAVVRALAFQLSKLRPGAKDARAIDDRRDGVYMTDLGTRIAAYNGTGRPVVRTLPDRGETKQLEIPAWRLTVTGRADPIRISIALDAELTGYEPADRAGVLVPNGAELSVRVAIPKAGRYAVFARTLREGRLWAPRIEVGPVQVGTIRVPTFGDYYLVGEFELPEGEAVVKFHGSGGHVAESLVVTDDLTVAGFKILRRP